MEDHPSSFRGEHVDIYTYMCVCSYVSFRCCKMGRWFFGCPAYQSGTSTSSRNRSRKRWLRCHRNVDQETVLPRTWLISGTPEKPSAYFTTANTYVGTYIYKSVATHILHDAGFTTVRTAWVVSDFASGPEWRRYTGPTTLWRHKTMLKICYNLVNNYYIVYYCIIKCINFLSSTQKRIYIKR